MNGPFAVSVKRKRKNKKMKKLMIAAAAAALVGGAFAADCGECADKCTPCAEPCPFGYRLKVMVRTTASCNVTKGSECGECSSANYRGPVIRRFMGMVYGTVGTEAGNCGEQGCACNDWKDTANIALYDYDHSLAVALDYAELIQLNRIGCKAADRNKAEMAFSVGFLCNDKPTGAMTFAGFGLCGNHNGKITIGSISGYCAGLLPAGQVEVKDCKEVSTCGNLVWNLCCNTSYTCTTTAAYGKWTLVWDSDVASKVSGATESLNSANAFEVKTGWGTAKAVPLADARACKDVACVNPCGE